MSVHKNTTLIHKIYNATKTFIVLMYLNFVAIVSAIISMFTWNCNIWNISRRFMTYLHVHVRVTEKSEEIHKGKTMFFCNHRSWADFFTDTCLCGGPSYISRYAVVFGVPGMAFCAWLNGFIWLFRRRRGIDRTKFTEFFVYNWKYRYNDGVIVYPEGHRFQEEGYLPLKTGVMEVAYNLNCPVQCVLTSNKEQMLNEKALCLEFNTTLVSSVSRIIMPNDYKTKEEWFQACRDLWEETYQDLKNHKDTAKTCDFPLPGIKPEETNSYHPVRHRVVYTVLANLFVVALSYCIKYYLL